MAVTWPDLVEGVLQGNVRAMARLITLVENRGPGWWEAMKTVFPHTGRGRIVGLTGTPGAGKSTLAFRLAGSLADQGFPVGIIAVDPSSVFSGGALLGDRLRMQDLATRPEVFIRSMATRGAVGGLCQAALDAARIMDAFGKSFILLETVGVGQDEVDVVLAADLVVVVTVPGQGDAIQIMKAGFLEIADLFLVNKADREGAEEVASNLETLIEMSASPESPRARVLRTVAATGQGISELAGEVIRLAHQARRLDSRERKRTRNELLALAQKELMIRLEEQWSAGGLLDRHVDEVLDRRSNPYALAESLVRGFLNQGKEE